MRGVIGLSAYRGLTALHGVSKRVSGSHVTGNKHMENHYRINVAKANGRNWDNSGPRYLHFFATEVRDLINAKQVHAELLAAFPAPEYSISVTRWEASGTGVEF